MDPALVGVVIAGVTAAVGPVLVYRVNKRSTTTDAAQRQIDQIQEDREDDRKQFSMAAARFEERQQRLENRLESMEARERQFSDYILTLRWHIAEQKPPPPPAFPPDLLKPFDDPRG